MVLWTQVLVNLWLLSLKNICEDAIYDCKTLGFWFSFRQWCKHDRYWGG